MRKRDDLSRRSFLLQASQNAAGIAAVGAALALCPSVYASVPAPEAPWPSLVAVRNGAVPALYERAVRAAGGLDRFVAKGSIVTVKPCMQWAAGPEDAVNSSPALVKALVEDCFLAGAAKVYVFDHTADYWKNAYRYSGIADAAKEAGASVVPAHLEKYYTTIALDGAKVLKTVKIHKKIVESDLFINLALLKQDSGTGMAGAMSNLTGAVWDWHALYELGIGPCIADLGRHLSPALTLLEAGRVLASGGPRGVYNSSYLHSNMLLASQNMQALDTCGAMILGRNPADISYLEGGYELKNLTVQRISL